MTKLALYMLKNDTKCIFRGWWAFIVFPFIVISLFVSPFLQDFEYYYMAYMMFVILSLFRPRFTKIYHVLPLKIEQIRSLYFLRTVLLFICLLLGVLCIVGVAEVFGLNWNRRGGLAVMFYGQIFIGILHEKFWGFVDKKRKNNGLMALAIVGVIISAFVMFGMLDLFHMPLIWQYVVQALLLLTGIPHVVFISKEMDFYDYEIPTDLYGNRLDVEK